jgi:hypothetical protein
MKATANQIGNSKKERVEVDGKVFLQSVNVGRWTHVVRVVITGGLNAGTYTGKSASAEAAAKWIPFSDPCNGAITRTIARIER